MAVWGGIYQAQLEAYTDYSYGRGETQFEAKRWLDMRRTGTVKERILAATGQVVADKHLLWPIPVSELNYNKAINPSSDQNPGY